MGEEFQQVGDAELHHVRVGLEDNLYLEPGVFASNAQLVERAVQIIQLLGARNLGPEETRQRLELKRAG